MKTLTAALMLIPALAFAAPAAPSSVHQPDPLKQARFEKQLRTFRTIGLAEALDLDAATALQLDAQMAQFDDRRKPLQEQLKSSKQILERAADGDPAAAAQVDQAIEQAVQARAQIEQINRDMLSQISRGMQPQQKAKLALFLTRFKGDMVKRMMRGGEMRGMHHGEHRDFGGGGEAGE